MEPVGGSMLGRYEVIRHLASGGMADLLLARARGLEGFERHVVIKRIRADAEDDQAFIDMFLVEARLAAALHHHNIVQVYDIGEENGKPYFAMEYVHGEDLRRLLATVVHKREQLPLPVVVTIVTAVARALHHAHEQKGGDLQPLGIVHRDVSPANIIVGYDGNVKVLDFGIARAAMRRTETQAGMLKGKAPYMAPEQCTGAPVDRRSDVFALGIVLYELTTARRLFKAENDHLTMMTIVNGTIPKPSTIRKDLPPELESIILRALSRDPASRFQTAEQMFVALEQLAVNAEWRTSASVLEHYMTQVFGSRTEPWLASEPTASAVSVDFDGVGTGLARRADTDQGAVPAAVVPTTSSPIMRTRTELGGNGVPKSAEAAVSSRIQIPDASGPAVAKSAATKPAARVAVTATPPRGRPKTVQVPVPKSETKANVEPKPAAKVDAALEATEVLPTPNAAVKPAAKVDGAALDDTQILPVATVAAKPEARADSASRDTEVLPTTRAAAKTEVTRVERPKTEVDERMKPIMDDPDDTHTEAQALPPSISPHAPRQLKPLPGPNVARTLTPKPSSPVDAAPSAGAQNGAAKSIPASGAPATTAAASSAGAQNGAAKSTAAPGAPSTAAASSAGAQNGAAKSSAAPGASSTVASSTAAASATARPATAAASTAAASTAAASTAAASTASPATAAPSKAAAAGSAVAAASSAVAAAGVAAASSLAKLALTKAAVAKAGSGPGASAAAAAATTAPAKATAATNGTSPPSEDASTTSPTMVSNPAKQEAAAAAKAASANDFAEEAAATSADIEDSTEVSSIPEEEAPPYKRAVDPTAIVTPLPSPMLDAGRARRKSTVPVDASMTMVEETDQLNAPARPRWMLPAIGGGVLVLAIIVFAIARSGGDDALDAPPPETASVTEPPTPEPTAAPDPDEVRTEARPRTWANSQQPDTAGSAATPDPTPAPTPATPDPTPPIAAEGSAAPAEPAPAAGSADSAAIAPTEPDPIAPTEPEPIAPIETPDPPDPRTDATDAKPAVATTKPTTKPTKPATKPAIAKTTKPATKPAIAKATKPAPKPKPKPKTLPKPNWNPNTLFPNKK